MSDADPTANWATVSAAGSVPHDRCIVAGAGAAVVVLTEAGPRAYVNRCPHNGLPLDDCWVRDGVLTCPHHFWRFDAATGAGLTEPEGLTELAIDGSGSELRVALPKPAPPESFRERQLRHARTWKRDER